QIICVTTGVRWSWMTTTCNPLASVKVAGGSDVTPVWAKLPVEQKANAVANAMRADVTKRFMGIATFGWLREQMTQTQRSIVHGAADADGHEIGRRVRTAPLAFTICRRFQPALSISG